jgi:two-component system, LuxR family, sensor kinase FixL
MEEIETLRAQVCELEARLVERADADSFRRVVESAPYGMVVSDAAGGIVLVNPKAVELFGHSAAEFLELRIEDLVPPRFRPGHDGLRRGFHGHPEPRSMGAGRDLYACRRDGSEFPVEIALTPLEIGGGAFVLSSIIDITRRKRDEEELVRYAKKLERSNAELESFASIASHDLQEPLRKIRMMGERLATLCGDELGEQGLDYLGRMIRASDNMHRLIRDLLSFSRVGMRAEGFRKTSLAGPVRDALSTLELLIEESGAEILVGDLPLAEVDESQMRQLFQNLIGNALKFRRESETPRVEIHGTTDEADADPVVRVEVRDNGIGFDEQYHDRIFQIFQRLHGKTEFEGTGIGLAICKKIIDRHDGRIYARSRPGEGATFIVELPLRQKLSPEKTLKES